MVGLQYAAVSWPSVPIIVGVLFAAFPAVAQDAPGLHMQIDGTHWASNRSAVFKTKLGKSPALNINGFLDGARTAHLAFTVTLAGENDYLHHFELGTPKSGNSGNFSPNMLRGDPTKDTYRVKSGELTITSFDAARKTISGTFDARLQNLAGDGRIEITDGVFTDVDVSP